MTVQYFLIFGGVFALFLVGAYLYSFIHSRRFSKYAKMTGSSQPDLSCPNCSSDLSPQINGTLAKPTSFQRTTLTVRCSCGTNSVWDVVGSPPALKSYEKKKVN